MYQEIKPFEHAQTVLEKAVPGIFLNTSFGGVDNTMIIGWGGINVVWGRPIFIVMVRSTRATHQLIEKSGEFTVSIPTTNQLKKEIQICGTKSMREMDKFAACGFTKIKGRVVDTPIIAECDLHYECKVIYKQTLDPMLIPEVVANRYYASGAIHTVYYGEIVDQYIYRKE